MKGLGGLRSALLNLSIKDVDELYACYMPFVKNSGLFIETRHPYKLGDEVFVVLEMLDEPNKFPLSGKVIWVTPGGAVSNRKQGIGIQLSEENAALVKKIELHLAGLLNTDRTTHTL